MGLPAIANALPSAETLGYYLPMKILALELSSARGSIALLQTADQSAGAPTAAREGACAPQNEEFVREWPNDRKNSGPFFEHLAEVQKEFGNPETIIVGLGPGSYAGTRIAISAAIGLSFGGTGQHGGRPSIRLIGFPSICAIECEAREYFVIGDARRHTFFFARVRNNELIEGPTLMSEAELQEKLDKIDKKMPIFTTEKLLQFERAEIRYPSAKVLAGLGAYSKAVFAQSPLEPMYLREPHITVPKK
jgi:tRNA threonylcarbamoyladenosine biosynthesis protein TsaB